MKRVLQLLAFLVALIGPFSAGLAAQTPVRVPRGIYVLNEASNEQSPATAYNAAMFSSPAYLNDVDGHAIFVPLKQVLPVVNSWGQFIWQWDDYLGPLVQDAITNHKKFSIALEIGFQASTTFEQSLPQNFAEQCGADCAPLFDVWSTGSGGRCISAYIPLPWNPKVQEMWESAANDLARYLKEKGWYDSLTMIHVPGLSVYDEEVRLPAGFPQPTADLQCPDGRYSEAPDNAVETDASTANWIALGYSNKAAIRGSRRITEAFARNFPNRTLGLSLFNPNNGGHNADFPNVNGTTPLGSVAARIVKKTDATAPKLELQSDDLDSNFVLSEVTALAQKYGTIIGWQTNKHAGTGAGCGGGAAGSCGPDGADSPYFQLIQNGASNGGTYLEVWSTDVVDYPLSFAAAKAAGYFPK